MEGGNRLVRRTGADVGMRLIAVGTLVPPRKRVGVFRGEKTSALGGAPGCVEEVMNSDRRLGDDASVGDEVDDVHFHGWARGKTSASGRRSESRCWLLRASCPLLRVVSVSFALGKTAPTSFHIRTCRFQPCDVLPPSLPCREEAAFVFSHRRTAHIWEKPWLSPHGS